MTLRRLLPILPLAACIGTTGPAGPDEVRLRLSGTALSGEAGYAVTNAELRSRVAGECAAAGLRFGSMSVGRTEGGARAVRATCA